LRERFRTVRNLIALDDALPRRACTVRPGQFGMRTWLRVMVLEIPIGSDKCLPDAVQIGTAIGKSRRAIRGWELRAGRRARLSNERGRCERDERHDTGRGHAEKRDRASKGHRGPPKVPAVANAGSWYHERRRASRRNPTLYFWQTGQ